MRIGLISDTHGYLDERVFDYFVSCDEIWHAGDIGTLTVAAQLASFKPLRAVYGNIDAGEIRQRYPEHQHFACGKVKVWMTHIGGYPPNYTPALRKQLDEFQPDLFICGHSHILKVIPDPARKLLHLNPGAAGHEGFHPVRTLLRFAIHPEKQGVSSIEQLEIIELGKRGKMQRTSTDNKTQ
ncbi:MAG: metallophosphatase family protein [Bernardetiaceae bacterium]|nr:metallophosphatase family protein [Bernardetiaceae bacterium]